MCICLSEYGCVHICTGVQVGQKRVLDLMELELKVVASCEPFSMGAGTQTQILYKSNAHS